MGKICFKKMPGVRTGHLFLICLSLILAKKINENVELDFSISHALLIFPFLLNNEQMMLCIFTQVNRLIIGYYPLYESADA